MKSIRSATIVLSLIFSLTTSYSQDHKKELSPGYYVVVGAYASTRENIAQLYVDRLQAEGHDASYGFNEARNMYFVYLRYFDNLKSALQDMEKTRRNNFPDAWVRVVAGDVAVGKQPVSGKDKVLDATDNATKKDDDIAPKDTSKPGKPDGMDKDETLPPPVVQITASDSAFEVTENEEIIQYDTMTLGNTEVFLSLFNARNNRIVSGDVQVVDTERAKQITKVKGNEYLLLPDPKSKSGQLTLICEAFGYRKVQQEINYPLPLADTVKPFIDLMGTTLVVNFDLIRYHKGDIATLYNVYFYNDAALMLPESRYELQTLLQMMEELPYRIKLHGHTNGNYHGRIISLGPDKNLFSLDGSQNSIGTAKDLSRLRAEVIKEFLVGKGIAADRIEVKAWGGKRPLYDKHSANAKKNVRVEVEILED
ncbi:MAG TPA: OmpA family protein [Ohtaekwangia sp.]|nr:OmpA family protein [Ohtaekwangia sp.]